MNLQAVLKSLNVSESNQANVKSILTKLFTNLEIKRVNKRTLNNTEKILSIVQDKYSSKKWVEVCIYILKVATLLQCKEDTLNKYKTALETMKQNHLSNYNKTREFTPDSFQEHKDKLKKYFEDKDPIKRKISKLSYYLGGLRKGELLNCKITNLEAITNDKTHNCFNVFDKKLYIIHHKTKSSKGTRIIDLQTELVDEFKDDVDCYLIKNKNNNKSISPNTYQKYFKSMADINPLDYRHLHAVNNTKQPPAVQQEEATKLGHSLSTSHFIYSNSMVDKTVSKSVLDDAKKYYRQLKQLYKEQQEEKDKFILRFE